MIVVSHQHPRKRFPVAETRRAIRAVARVERKTFSAVSVVFTTNAFIRTINRKFLRHDFVTDIVTFEVDPDTKEAELYINLDAAKAQAREYGATFREEVERLIVHGMLHLCGYDDGTPAQRARMHRRENTYLERLRNN